MKKSVESTIKKKFNGEIYTLHGIRQTKSWAKKETKKLRETGFKVRNTKFPNKVTGGTYYYVWKRKG